MPESADIQSLQILVGDVRCHYLEAGQGEPLVLLHGTAIDSATLSYAPSLPTLAKVHRVIALDWPGYGQSELPRVSHTINDYVGLLLAFFDVKGLNRVHLAGFSMGGAVALGVALRAPRLRKAAVWSLRRSRLLTQLVLNHLVFADASLVTPQLIDAVHNQLRTPEAERSFLAWLRGELRPFRYDTSYADRLPEVKLPTLLLHGQRDRVISWRNAEAAHRQLPQARLVVTPRCGHWLPREVPEIFQRELLTFTSAHPIPSLP
jgi:pimeloyl-ACP methyl ester carboxylesterase